MPAKSCFRFIGFVTFGAGIGFLIGMPQHVSLQVVLAPTGMWTEGAFKWLYSLMDPNVFLELRVCSNEHFITVRALVASSTCAHTYMYLHITCIHIKHLLDKWIISRALTVSSSPNFCKF